MNKKDFKKYMQQGLGRCILVLQSSENIEKYKEIVLWGCLHNLSYDTQCEGTRASYIYELTTYFNDEDYFLLPCIEAFEKIPRRSDWLFSHFTELLCRFAENGNKRAECALIQKYDYLLSVLLNKRRFISYDFERDNFERVCITLSSLGGTDTLLKIAADMGMLFRKNPHYSGSDFDWFCSSMDDGIGEKRLHILLKREAKKSDNIACFYDNYLKAIEETKNIVRSPIEILCAEDIKNEVDITGSLKPSSRVRFLRRANEDEKLKLAQEVIAEQNPDKKAEMLSTFAFLDESFPLSHETIIEYSKSSHERLREVSFDVLTDCQSCEVREYALKLLATGKYKAQAIQMLLCNYRSADKALLLSELGKIKVNYNNESDWHSIGSKILNVCDQGIKLPKEFFVYIYETTLCSCCREYAVRALAKHHWLTRDIIEECRYDSNYDISQYINRYYPVNN